jgi:AcrR family transcriptional regulator
MSARGEESARRRELLDLTFQYVAEKGISDLSLRPLAAAIGTSPRVLLDLFASKDGLVREVLGLARERELEFVGQPERDAGLGPQELRRLWDWLADPANAPVLRLWCEGYARSLQDREPWSGFGAETVGEWLDLLRRPAAAGERDRAEATLTLAVVRGLLLDLLATGDRDRTRAALERFLAAR